MSFDPAFIVDEQQLAPRYDDHSPGADMGYAAAARVEVHDLATPYTPVSLPPDDGYSYGEDEAMSYLEDPYFTPGDIYSDAYDVAPQPLEIGAGCSSAEPCSTFDIAPSDQSHVRAFTAGDHQGSSDVMGHDPVNLESGELLVRAVDIAYPGFGVPYRHVRTYRSRVDYDGPLGYGWDHSYNQRLLRFHGADCGAQMLYMTGEATTIAFVEVATAETQVGEGAWVFETTYQAPPGVHLELRSEGTRERVDLGGGNFDWLIRQTWTMTAPAGIVWRFDEAGLLVRLEDLNGQGLTLAWEPSVRDDVWRLATVTDSAGRVVGYEYDADGRLRAVEGPELRAEYQVEGSDLARAIDAQGRTEIYGYDSGHPLSSADHYVPERALQAGCEQACSAERTWCGQTGACWEIAATGQAACQQSCAQCEVVCGDSCASHCRGGCREGTESVSGCGVQCTEYCQQPDVIAAMCDAAYVGDGAEDPNAETPQDYCFSCDERVLDECGFYCATAAVCLTYVAGTPEGENGEQAAAACAAEYGLDGPGLQQFVEDVVNLAGLAIIGAGESLWCGVTWLAEGFCDFLDYWLPWDTCDVEEDCDFDETIDAFQEACNNYCYNCAANGDDCDPNSCQDNHTCEGECQQAFLYGIPDGRCGYPTGGGCPDVIQPQCREVCIDTCVDNCSVPCTADCQSACADVCGNSTCMADCAAVDFVGLCESGCFDGCVQSAREQTDGAPRYGYPRDLNHNLVSARYLGEGGVEIEYLHNEYGDDVTQPSFDAVTRQVNGDRELTFHHRDLFAEERGELVNADSASIPYVIARDSFDTVDICPSACTEPNELGDGELVPWFDGLIVFDPRGLKPGGMLAAPATRGVAIPPTTLRVWRTSGGSVVASIEGADEPTLARGFAVTTPNGTASFAPTTPGSFGVTGKTRPLDDLVGFAEITVLTDRAGIHRAYPGRPRSLVHLASGACTRPFRAKTGTDGAITLTPSDACSSDLVVSPLATLVTDPSLIAHYESVGESAFSQDELFLASTFMPARYAVRWRERTDQRGQYEASVGPEGGAAPASLGSAAYGSAEVAPLFRAPPLDGASARPLVVFHLPLDQRPAGTHVDTPVFDHGSPFDAWETNPACLFQIPDEPRRGWGPNAPGAKPGRATFVIDAYGVAWTEYYDEAGRTIRTVNHDTAAVRSFSYDPAGDLVGIEDPLRSRQCLVWDHNGNLTEVTSFPEPEGLGEATPIRQRVTYSEFPSRPLTVRDPRNPARALVTFTWDVNGNLLSRQEGTGETTTFLPSPWGPPRTITDPSGAVTEITNDPTVGAVRSIVVDAFGPSPLATTVDYDPAGRPTERTGPLGEVHGWVWTNGRVSSSTRTADGEVEGAIIGYNEDARPSLILHGRDSVEILYDELGFARTAIHRALDGTAEEAATCRLVGPGGRVLEEVRPEGNRIRYDYDGEGRIVAASAGSWAASAEPWDDACAASFAGEPAFAELGSVEYDRNGRPVVSRDGTGAATAIQYDGRGRPAIVTQPDGTTIRTGFDRLGNPIWRAAYAPGAAVPYRAPTPGDGGLLAASSFEYDDAGRLVRVDRWHFGPTGSAIGDGHAVTRIDYDALHREVRVTDDTGAVTIHRTDGAGRPVAQVHANGDTVTTSYLEGGRSVRQEWPAPTPTGMRSQTLRLTPWGDIARVESGDGAGDALLEERLFDNLGRVTDRFLASGAVFSTTYDAFGRPSSASNDLGDTTELVTWSWNRNGSLATRTSDSGEIAATTSYRLDALDRVVRVDRPEGIYQTTTYLGGSSLVSETTDGLGTRTIFGRDEMGRVESIEGRPMNGSSVLRDFVRDPLGRVVKATHFGASLATAADDVTTYLTWDSLSNRVSESDTVTGLAVTHVHDGLGRAVSNDLAGVGVARAYDELGRPRTIGIDGTTAATFQYAGLGGPTSRLYASQLTTTYGYDALGRLSSLVDETPSGSLAGWRWETPLDGTPRIAALARGSKPEGASVFSVDRGGRIVHETHGIEGLEAVTLPAMRSYEDAEATIAPHLSAGPSRRYLLDARHNWLQRIASDPGLSVYAEPDAFDAYRSFGELVPEYDPRGALLRAGDDIFTYDASGDLVGFESDSATREYVYDALGRLVAERDLDTGELTRFGYDGLRRVVQEDPNGTIHTYVHGAGIDTPLVDVTASGHVYFHQDRLGSVYLLTDAAGQAIEHYDYTAFGEMTITDAAGTPRTVSSAGNRFGFQGHPFDPATGLVHMRARWYLPSWGRFLTPDPIGLLGGTNLYAFVDGASLSWRDPFGFSRSAADRNPTHIDMGLSNLLQMQGAGFGIASTWNMLSDPIAGSIGETIDVYDARTTREALMHGVRQQQYLAEFQGQATLQVLPFLQFGRAGSAVSAASQVDDALNGTRTVLNSADDVLNVADDLANAANGADDAAEVTYQIGQVLDDGTVIGMGPGARAAGSAGDAADGAGATIELFHGTNTSGARSILSEGLRPVSTNTAPFPAGSFFTHTGTEGQVAASHWAARSVELYGEAPVLLRGTVSRQLFDSLASQGLIKTGSVPGLPFFPPQIVILPEGLGAANLGMRWSIASLIF
jgi:RHS repeat-associated protein